MGSLDLKTGEWYGKFLDYLGIPVNVFPEVRYDSGDFGKTASEIFGAEIPITSSIADQHAALFAQGCVEAGTAKVTNGTGTFLDFNVGDTCVISEHGLNTVIAWDLGDGPMYALEGYAAVTGSAVQWLRDGIKLIESSKESEAMARSVEDSNGVYFVPALAGLSAPYHDPYARGMIIGITRGTTEAHIVRATLEAIAYRCRDISDCVEKEANLKMKGISIDGGASKHDLLAQLMADFMKAEVRRPASVEATSLGAAMLAGRATGFYSKEMLGNALESEKVFTPEISAEKCDEMYEGWKKAIGRASEWLK
jgi:glycerol kinase